MVEMYAENFPFSANGIGKDRPQNVKDHYKEEGLQMHTH